MNKIVKVIFNVLFFNFLLLFALDWIVWGEFTPQTSSLGLMAYTITVVALSFFLIFLEFMPEPQREPIRSSGGGSQNRDKQEEALTASEAPMIDNEHAIKQKPLWKLKGLNALGTMQVQWVKTHKKRDLPYKTNPLYFLVPRTRIELVRGSDPEGF